MPVSKDNINDIRYRCPSHLRKTKIHESIQPIGLDTEAYTDGECFMIATSEGDVFKPYEFPKCMFNRKYRQKSFVCYNLKYDAGAFIRYLPVEHIEELRATGSCDSLGFIYKVIANKCLTIRKGKNAIHIYDMYNFYHMSLDQAAQIYLGEKKHEVQTEKFTREYTSKEWNRIAGYCINDAKLCQQLSDILVRRFEKYGVYPKKLYSVAYISYQYFRQNCLYVTVKRYWQKEREVLSYAIKSYNGGKFEVTEKGIGYYYEYDINSAYPFEIRNLIDISWARVVKTSKYRKGAVYGFLKCIIKIPFECSSPCAIKRGTVNTYPVGEIEKYITKAEYEYLINQGCDIKIIDAYWLHIDNKQYPYRKEIDRLYRLKQGFKSEHKDLDYHTIKIFLNSLYGKFIQLINKGEYYAAGSSWNPIYGAVITANCRIRMSNMQQLHNGIVAVHTDSIISKARLPIEDRQGIGQYSFTEKGKGVILGSGIYQIGEKVRFRGFPLKISLLDLVQQGKKTLSVSSKHAYTWREVVFRGWESDMINRFVDLSKSIDINFDQKRFWLDDWRNFSEVTNHKVESLPLIFSDLLY